ncbi:MAG: hypothetical protein ACRDS0_31485 [Pseudonocardiaceae bacterium]
MAALRSWLISELGLTVLPPVEGSTTPTAVGDGEEDTDAVPRIEPDPRDPPSEPFQTRRLVPASAPHVPQGGTTGLLRRALRRPHLASPLCPAVARGVPGHWLAGWLPVESSAPDVGLPPASRSPNHIHPGEEVNDVRCRTATGR